MKRWVLLVAVAGWFVPLSCHASADTFLDGQIQLVQSQIQHYVNMAHLLEVFTACVAITGVAVAALQPAEFAGKKFLVGILGVVSTIIVIVNHTFFPAEYRAYNKVADQARIKLNAFSRQLSLYATMNDATRTNLRQQFAALQNEIDQMEYTTIDNATQANNVSASSHGFSFLPTAWAQEDASIAPAAPDWAKQVPVDGNLYYLGTADGRTFEEAQTAALANARTGAAGALVKGAAATTQLAGKPELIAKLAKALGESAEVAQTFVAPAPSGGFRGYVLLRLSRSAGGFIARSIFTQAGVPYDEAFLDRIRGEATPEQRKSTARVYLQIASEDQRPAAQSIQEALIKAGYSVPGTQNVAGKGYIPDTLEVRYFDPGSKAEAEKILGLIKSQGAKDGRTSYVIPTAHDLQISSDIKSHFEVWAGKTSL